MSKGQKLIVFFLGVIMISTLSSYRASAESLANTSTVVVVGSGVVSESENV